MGEQAKGAHLFGAILGRSSRDWGLLASLGRKRSPEIWGWEVKALASRGSFLEREVGHSAPSCQSCQGTVQMTLPHSTTGTRARVARVRAECPDQLDFSGSYYLAASATILPCRGVLVEREARVLLGEEGGLPRFVFRR